MIAQGFGYQGHGPVVRAGKREFYRRNDPGLRPWGRRDGCRLHARHRGRDFRPCLGFRGRPPLHRLPAKDKEEKGKDQGVLLGSGFIAGEGLMGVVIAIIAVVISKRPEYLKITYSPLWVGEIVSVIAFTALGYFLYRVAAKSRVVS